MIDERKVILMSKLALYEKRHIKEDKRRSNYYREDYIYIKNFKTRICITIAVLLYAGIDVLNRINNGENMPYNFSGFFERYIMPYGVLLAACLFIYTIISSSVYSKRYDKSQKRIKSYKNLLNDLQEYDKDKLSDWEEGNGIK